MNCTIPMLAIMSLESCYTLDNILSLFPSLRYSIDYVPLAVHELEDRELGRFSFRSRDDVMKVLQYTV